MQVHVVGLIPAYVSCDEYLAPVYQVSGILVPVAEADEIVVGEKVQTVVLYRD